MRLLPTPDFRTLAAKLLAVSSETQTAKYLAIAPSTMRQYLRSNRAPRRVTMALFWITSLGKRQGRDGLHRLLSDTQVYKEPIP
jgi:predicted transcriptional regulator